MEHETRNTKRETRNIHFFEQSMRWFGPDDPVSLQDIRQAGASQVVTALHQYASGEIWSEAAIVERKKLIEAAGLHWTVVESVNVSEDIKRQTGDYKKHIENYNITLQHLANHGIKVVTYNFMPVIDWVRTNLFYTVEDGSKAMYFEKLAFIAFDLFVLKRPNAANEYSSTEIEAATTRFQSMTTEEIEVLLSVMLAGLPGSDDNYTIAQILDNLAKYSDIDDRKLRENLYFFLNEVAPFADTVGIRLAIHADDPPFSVLGLPRITSTEDDIRQLFEAVPCKANGLCFCSGSFGTRRDNDLSGMVERLGDRIYFAHLRSTQHDDKGNFYEANHLEGDTDMFSIVRNLVILMNEKRNESIPIRPDHGHQMLDDIKKTQKHFGYSAIGRLRGLAELRGLEMGISKTLYE